MLRGASLTLSQHSSETGLCELSQGLTAYHNFAFASDFMVSLCASYLP